MPNPNGYNQYQSGPGAGRAKMAARKLFGAVSGFVYGTTTTTVQNTGKSTTRSNTPGPTTKVNRGSAPRGSGVKTRVEGGGLMGFKRS